MMRANRAILVLLLTSWSSGASACALGAVYNLPIPFAMYATGAALALIVSFVIVAFVLKTASPRDSAGVPAARRSPRQLALPEWVVTALTATGLLALLLTIATGLVGSRNPLANFNMTFFWIVFMLGLTYLTALVGDIYALANPWRALCDALERWRPAIFRGWLPYPGWLGYFPALGFYVVLIWIELFGQIQPRTLSWLLIAYAGVNVTAAWLVGKETWFRHGEFFAVFFGLIGRIAPVEYLRDSTPARAYHVRLRKPFTGLLGAGADHGSLLLFVIFMLSSTAFDGAHDTVPWVGMFWRGLYPLLSVHIGLPYLIWVSVYYLWQSVMLLLMPLCYLAVYLLLLWLAKWATHSTLALRTLALRFAFTLIPIAFVYNVTHYYGEFSTQGVQILRMISDPFNRGWDLFGTSQWFTQPIVLDVGTVWHTQVALILAGHIISVYLAHVEALKVFPTARHALLSQLPMLLLMVFLTTAGLWILSLPIDAGQLSSPV